MSARSSTSDPVRSAKMPHRTKVAELVLPEKHQNTSNQNANDIACGNNVITGTRTQRVMKINILFDRRSCFGMSFFVMKQSGCHAFACASMPFVFMGDSIS